MPSQVCSESVNLGFSLLGLGDNAVENFFVGDMLSVCVLYSLGQWCGQGLPDYSWKGLPDYSIFFFHFYLNSGENEAC